MYRLFTFLAAVHVVTLEVVGGEERGQAVLQCYHWTPEPTVYMHKQTPAVLSLDPRTNCLHAQTNICRAITGPQNQLFTCTQTSAVLSLDPRTNCLHAHKHLQCYHWTQLFTCTNKHLQCYHWTPEPTVYMHK